MGRDGSIVFLMKVMNIFCKKHINRKNDPNDKMNEFIDGFIFNRNNHIKKLDDIGYHKIGEVFKYDIGSGIIELAVIEDDGSGCDGCIFNDRNYYCKNTCCINVDRKDSTDIIYKEVKRS